MTQKTPRIVIRQEKNKKMALVVNDEVRLIANAIFEKKIFDSGNRVAVISQERNATLLFIVTIEPSMEETIPLQPRPSPGFDLRLITEKEGKNFAVHFRSGKKFYVFHYLFDRLQILGPFNEATTGAALQIHAANRIA